MISVCRVSIDFQMLLPVPPSRQSESLMLITETDSMKGPTPEPSELSQGARISRVIIEEMKTTYTPIIHTSKKSFVKPQATQAPGVR